MQKWRRTDKTGSPTDLNVGVGELDYSQITLQVGGLSKQLESHPDPAPNPKYNDSKQLEWTRLQIQTRRHSCNSCFIQHHQLNSRHCISFSDWLFVANPNPIFVFQFTAPLKRNPQLKYQILLKRTKKPRPKRKNKSLANPNSASLLQFTGTPQPASSTQGHQHSTGGFQSCCCKFQPFILILVINRAKLSFNLD